MAGIPRTDSIVADSIVSSSPPRPIAASVASENASSSADPYVPPKRVSRTYGRPKNGESIGQVAQDDPGSRARILKTAPRDADDQVIPASDDVDEHGPSFDGFDWRAKLKAIDEDFDDSDTKRPTANASTAEHGVVSGESHQEGLRPSAASPLSELSHLSLAGPVDQTTGATAPTTTGEGSLFSSSRLTLLTSDPPLGSSPSGGQEIPSDNELEVPDHIPKLPRLSHKRVLTSPDVSDSENASPKHPYAINSPKTRSSTPPTSPFEVDANPGETRERGEGFVNDSKFEEVEEYYSKKAKGKGKKRIKGLTKKDVLESQKESARLLADQHVSIRRIQTPPVHTMANLFEKLKDDPPTTLKKQDSDPITSFSSPNHPFMTRGLASFSVDISPIKPSNSKAAESRLGPIAAPEKLPPAPSLYETTEKATVEDDSDEEMPDLGSLLRDQDEKRQQQAREQMERGDAAKRAKELEAHKRKVLELNKAHAGPKATSSGERVRADTHSDSDDDLEIVEDMVNLPAQKLVKDRSLRPFSGIGTHRESSSRSKSVSQRNLELAARPTFIAAQNKKGSKRTAGHGTPVSQKELNALMLQRAGKQGGFIEEKKKEQWVKAGGTLKETNRPGVPEKSITDWLNKGSTREGAMEVDERDDDEEDDAEDPEYLPDADTRVVDNSDDETSETGVLHDELPTEHRMELSEDETNADTDTDKENLRPAQRRRTTRVIDSDDEDSFARPGPSQPLPVVLVPDTSFAMDNMDSPSEDKENSAELAFDFSEDKENATVPRHLPRGRVLSTDDASPSPIFQASYSFQVGREPLSALDPEEESGFLPSLAHRRDSSQGRVLQVLHEEDKHSRVSPPTSARRGLLRSRTSSFSSPGSIGDRAESPKPFLGAGFSQLFDAPDGEETGPAPAVGQGSFSQFFSPGGIANESPLSRKGYKPFVHSSEHRDDFQFTQPNALLPSIKISESQRREVDEMFGKDQEFKLDEAKRSREQGRSSEASDPGLLNFKPFALSQPTQISPQSIRRPLETLSLDSGDLGMQLDESPEVSFKRGRLLRGRREIFETSPSPSPVPRNAFDVLRDAAAKGKGKERAPKQRLEKSEYVEAEAQESDEEAMLGFGGAKGDDEDEGGEEDPNAVVEGLVDDAAMDAKVQAANLVLEKHLEHKAADDAVIEKLHQDAVAGKLRGKRRDRGLGFEDSDSDEEDYKGPRKPLYKKRRIEGDTLESYGQNPETKAFYDAYQAELAEDADPRLAHLQQVDPDAMPEAEASESSEDEEEPETVDSAEVRKRIRELHKGDISPERGQNFQDLSWMENEDEEMKDEYRVDELPFHLRKSAPSIGSAFDHLDYRDTSKNKKSGTTAENAQLKSWASQEARAHSSASGRGGFSRKEGSSNSGPRKQRGLATTGRVSATRDESRPIVKSSTLMSQMEKRKGFDS